MNGLFPRLGKSLVSLSICNQDVFLAKVTLRSDIRNRASLFTNALVIPLKEYRHLMRTSPQAVALSTSRVRASRHGRDHSQNTKG